MSRVIIFALVVLAICFATANAKLSYGPGEQDWGYVDVRKGAHMFYWLYYTTGTANYTDRPLAIWLQGGPGASSTGYSNFEELGLVEIYGNYRNHTWVKDMNVLFIDNPVGSGFSYVDSSEHYTTNNTQIAWDLVSLMKGFYKNHPEFEKVPLHIFCESYGCKMAPEFALELYYAIQRGELNLTSVSLGDPWTSPTDSVPAWVPLLLNTGIFDDDGYKKIIATANKTADSARLTPFGTLSTQDHNWVHTNTYSDIPPFAIHAGNDSNGDEIYVGRAYHNGDMLLAKVIPSRHQAYVAWGGEEHEKHDVEVLTGHHYSWIPSSGGSLPPHALRVGQTNDGEPLYVGRGHWQDSLTPGIIHPSHGCLYIQFGGGEHRLDSYEVLVQPKIWVPSSGSLIVLGAIQAGYDADGNAIYVGRANHESDLLPGKVIPSKGYAYVSYNGHEYVKDVFELLVGYGYGWVPDFSGRVPPGAVVGGRTAEGETLYVGRALYSGSFTPGKIQPSHGCLYIPFGGGEHRMDNYEVLVQSEYWVPSTGSLIVLGAIQAGYDADGNAIYVGRANHESDLLPAKVIPSKGYAYVSYDGYEYVKDFFELLVGYGYGWVPDLNGRVPPGAVVGGRTSEGETLYVGRALYSGSFTLGKIQPSHGCLYIPFGGQEVRLLDYEVLVRVY